MDETQVILLLAVIAVIVLSVAVIILLPKDKPAPRKVEDEEDKKAKKKAAKQSKPRMVVPNVKVGRIKDFNEPEESNEDLLSYYSKGKNKEPSQPVVKAPEEKKKPAKQPAQAKQQPHAVEDADYITIQQKAKKEKVAEKAEKKDESQKKKKGFYKPEIAKEINEGRKKSKGEEAAANEEVVQEQPAENKKKEKKNKPAPQKQEVAEGEKPQENAEGQPKFGGGRGAPIKKPYVPGPIKNTGLDVASLEDMMNAITNYYGKDPTPPQKRTQKAKPAAAKVQGKEVPKARPPVPHIWNVLDHSVFVDIVTLLPLKEMLNLALVDKWFQSSIKSERLWKKMCVRDFGVNEKLPTSKTFKHTYQKSFSKKK